MLGVQYSFIGKIERGEHLPNPKVVVQVADFFDVPLDNLMRDELELD